MTMASINEDFRHVYRTTMFEFTKHMKRKRLVIALFLAILLPLIFFIIPKAIGQGFDNIDDFISNSLGFANLLIIISAAFFAGDVISSEFDKRTCLTSFPLPQRRTSFLTGKYLAAFIAAGMMITIYYIIIFIEAVSLFGIGSLPFAYATSYTVALLYTLAIISFTYFFSSLLKSSITSTLLSFFMLFMIFPIIQVVLQITGNEPWYLITYAGGFVTDAFGSVPISFSIGENSPQINMTPPTFYGCIGVLAAYAIILYLIGTIIGSRREVQ